MKLISDAYLEQNRKLHEQGSFGISGHLWAARIASLAEMFHCHTILDYGCGRQTLRDALKGRDFEVRGFDPAIPGLDAPPEKADLVACTDVLEHIEPEFLESVIAEIARCAAKTVFLVVHTGPAVKTLPDGRNAHLIQQPYAWWLPKFAAHWEHFSERVGDNAFWYAGKVRPA